MTLVLTALNRTWGCRPGGLQELWFPPTDQKKTCMQSGIRSHVYRCTVELNSFIKIYQYTKYCICTAPFLGFAQGPNSDCVAEPGSEPTTIWLIVQSSRSLWKDLISIQTSSHIWIFNVKRGSLLFVIRRTQLVRV